MTPLSSRIPGSSYTTYYPRTHKQTYHTGSLCTFKPLFHPIHFSKESRDLPIILLVGGYFSCNMYMQSSYKQKVKCRTNIQCKKR